MYSIKACFLVLFGALMLVGTAPLKGSEQPPVGMVLSLKGKATIIRASGERVAAKLKTPVYVGDRIETDFQSFIQVNFLDRSKVSLAGSSDFTVKDYHYDGKKKEARSELSVENGAMKFMAGKIAKIAPQNYKIHTTTATIGIRGSSGELVTSNGKLPGIPKGLQLMKTGGKGIMATLPGMQRPLPDITSSGKGLMIDNGGKVTQNIAFSGSLMKHYTKTSEKRVAEGKVKSKKEEQAKRSGNAKKGAQTANNEPEEEKEAEANNEPNEKKEEASSGEKQERQEEKKPERAERAQERSDDRISSRDQRQTDRQDPNSEGRGPATIAAKEGGMDHEPSDHPPQNMGTADAGDQPPPPMPFMNEGQEPPPFDSAMAKGGEPPPFAPPMGPPLDGHEPPPIPHLPPLENIGSIQAVAAGLQGAIAESENPVLQELLDQLLEELEEAATNEAGTQPPPAPVLKEFKGKLTGIMHTAGVTVRFADNVIAVDSNPGELIITPDNLAFELTMQRLPDGTHLSIDHEPEDVTNQEYTRIIDPNREVALINYHFDDTQGELAAIGIIGEESEAGELPQSGIRFYESEHEDGMPEGYEGDVAGAVLIRNNQLVNPAFESQAVVDFTHGKVIGIASIEEKHHDDHHGGPNDPNGATGAPPEEHHGPEDMTRIHTLYMGDVSADGTISNLNIYNNIGYSPSHVDIEGDLGTTAATYGLQDYSLDELTTSGQFYGSNAQGFSVEGQSNDTDFFAMGLEEQDDDPDIETGSHLFNGFGRGLKASGLAGLVAAPTELDSLSLTVDFDNSTVSGSMLVDGNTPTVVGTQGMAVNREIVAGSLTPASGANAFVGNNSFFNTLGLPEIAPEADATGHIEFDVPEDVLWGTWNIVKDSGLTDPIVFPGQHNFWVAGKQTVVDTNRGPNSWDHIGLNGARQVYRGMIMDTLVDPTGTIGGGNVHGWDTLDIGGDGEDIPTEITGVSGPIVETSMGHAVVAFDLDSNEMHGIAMLPNGHVIITKNSSNSATNSSFSSDMTLFSLHGTNVNDDGIFSSATANANALQGQFAGDDAQSAIFDYAVSGVSPGTLFNYGVGVLANHGEGVDDPTTDRTYTGFAHGVWIDEGEGATPTVGYLDGPTLDVALVFDPENYSLTGQIDIEGTGDRLEIQADNWNTFIDPGAFFARMERNGSGGTPVVLDNTVGNTTLDPDNVYILGMPGLEQFNHISWGMWAAKKNGGSVDHAMGYFGIGKSAVEGGTTMVPDFSALAVQPNPVVHYTGMSVGTLFDDHGQQFRTGSASINVDFQTGAVSGSLDLGTDAQVGLSGAINAATATFQGDATLNGGGNGAFGGGFYADEMAGSYGATNGTKSITGAFGAKADEAIPQATRAAP